MKLPGTLSQVVQLNRVHLGQVHLNRQLSVRLILASQLTLHRRHFYYSLQLKTSTHPLVLPRPCRPPHQYPLVSVIKHRAAQG